MSKLRKTFTSLALGMEENLDALLLALRKRFSSNDPLEIVTYRSYGTVNRLYVKGRVLKAKLIPKSSDKDSIWNNLVNMYKRFESDEVPHAHLRINFQNQSYKVATDKEGYFRLDLQTEVPMAYKEMWSEVIVELIEAPIPFSLGLQSTAFVLIPPADAEYGIISDIDDTIVKTSATSLLAMARNTFFHNAHTRLPFAGVSEFYKALQLGRNGKRNNPFFYVSSSPWNLYDLLIDFLDLNDIPEGPLLLRDFGLDADKVSADHMGHKFMEISSILTAYPQLKFVLIGDSGQEDPTIYREIVRKFPGRILAVYIRDVQLADREKIAVGISNELAGDQVEMIIVDNTVEAADHAAKSGLIYAEEIPKIIVDKKLDKGETPGKQAAP